MAFNLQFWGKVTSSMNTEFVIQDDGTHVSEGCRNIFSYQSLTDTIDDMLQANYFSNEAVSFEVCIGDFIYLFGSDETMELCTVSAVNSNTLVVALTLVPFGTGNLSNIDTVTIPAAGTLVEFTGETQFTVQAAAADMDEPEAPLRKSIDAWMEKSSPETIKRLQERLATNPRTVLSGIEALKFRALAAYIQLSDGLDEFGALGLFMDELHANRSLVIGESPTAPTSITAGIEIQSTKTVFVPSRLTDTLRLALASYGTVLNGSLFYNSTANALQVKISPSNTYTNLVTDSPHAFHYSFSLKDGGAGQSIPFEGISNYIALNMTPTNYNVFSVFNPQGWAIEDSGLTLRIPTSTAFNRAWYEIEVQLVVDMGSLPSADGNWGDICVATAPAYPTLVGVGRYTDNFHAGSGSTSGTTRYKAVAKGILMQSGGSSTIDDLQICFPIRNAGGPSAWTVQSGCISIRRVGVELN